ncbi:MAG: hypothetical protein HY751_13775 [Nitrospinae bacterium]|nr:hypothetical protein [Nitrospinota bacterium]
MKKHKLEKTPIVDYAYCDYTNAFIFEEIPWYWAGYIPPHESIEYDPLVIPPEIRMNESLIERGIRMGFLQWYTESVEKIDDEGGRSKLEYMYIPKYDLIALAEKINVKPAFLFPEVRGISSLSDKPLRNNQRHRERSRAIAQLLWKQNLKIKIEDMIHSDEINGIACEGKIYGPKTLRNWVNDLCPNRNPGRRPKE